MKNATLVINNSKRFEDDVWQTYTDFTEEQWQEVLDGFADTIGEARDELERLDPDNYECGDPLTYALSDIMNFFLNLGVKKEG